MLDAPPLAREAPPSRGSPAVTAVRWALVPPTAFAVWSGTLLIGIGGSSLLDSFCPPDLMISGICAAPWHAPAMTALEMLCATIAAVSFIVLPAAVAPTYDVQVAVGCFVVGGLLTIELTIAGGLSAAAAVAAIAGVITLWLTISRSRRRSVDGHFRQQSAVGQ
jgi:hypothetical protein